MKDKEYLIFLSTFPSFGPVRTKLLLSYFEKAENVWKASGKELREVGIKDVVRQKFLEHRERFDGSKYLGSLEKLKIEIITLNDPEYPENLKEISDAPYVLYVRGTLIKRDMKSIGIVGSRKMTSYGKDVCEMITRDLVHSGLTIISGFARGIDTTAHTTALKNNGRTIAVMAGGLDQIYPPENNHLVQQVIENGAFISEYPLGYPYLPASFPHRNRIISGLSKGVLIIEGTKKSGTIWTATHATNQNRTVFAIPGNITSFSSELPNSLIKDGATMVLDAKDITDELGVDSSPILQDTLFPEDVIEGQIIERLKLEPLHLDELARLSSISISEISGKLTVMELKGMVKHLGGGVYKKT
jgi:DNA processing protein